MRQNGRGKRWIGLAMAFAMALSLLPGSGWAAIYDGDQGEAISTKASVKVTLKYQYSSTGGMAGINAHSPETVEFFLNEDGTVTPGGWRIPYYDAEGNNEYHDHDHYNLQGFRVVLNTAPLDEFMVAPPMGNETDEELKEALNRGDFNLRDGVSEAELEEAWVKGRTFTDKKTGLIFQIVDKGGHDSHGSAALEGPQLVLQNPGALTGNKEVTLTVTYRRDNGGYTVRHLVPKNALNQDVNDPDSWEVESTEERQGRIGAMTTAEAKFILGYMNLAIAQQPIEVDGKTVIDIFYIKDDTFRVVFDTSGCNGEIDRQMPKLGETVDLSPSAAVPPTRDGYIFSGWSYREKNSNGSSGDLRPVTGLTQYNSATKQLTLDEDFLNHAYFQPSQETAGVNVLRLYPMWEPGPTQVRVVFWTEDLTGKADDVDSRVKGTAGALQVITHHYGENNAEYSNAGSVVLTDVRTGCTLNVAKDPGTLTYTNDAGNSVSLDLRAELAKLPTMEITTSYKGSDPKWSLTDASGFYSLDQVVVTQADGTAQTGDSGQAANTGTTVVNLYYTRNIYQLEFIYSNTNSAGDTVVALNTGGYANHDYSPDASSNNPHKVTAADELAHIPQRQIITAKYGADLRDVWPCHSDIQVRTDDTPPLVAKFIAWTPTAGPYNAEAIRSGSNVNLTIKGDYGAMSADMIGDPANYIDIKNENETYSETKAHQLYAYWSHYTPSQYRYNHCYEVPGVTPEMLKEEGEALVLDGQRVNDVRNLIYLIPADSSGAVMGLLNGYNFDDLRKATRPTDPSKGANGVVSDANGDYYAFRIYGGKCYALARQVDVVATNTIGAQNPSARSHMTQKNTVADHSECWQDGDGSYDKNPIGSKEEPAQLFFYYDRTPYTIFYSVGAYDLGQKTIYYGADLSPAYNIQLESGASADGVEEDARTNGEYAVSAKNPNGWDLPENDAGTVNVCPDRNAKGTKAWTFKGWALDQAGSALLEDEDWDGVVSGNLRLYAQWEAPKYTVEFDWNGGGLAFGADADYKVQEIAANTSFRKGGLVPTLVRSGYSQDSWAVTAYEINGQWHTLKPSQYQPFQIDSTITTNLRVRANWKEIEGANMYTYTVRHVLEGDRRVEVAEAQRVTGSFVPGSLVWGGPVKLEGKYAEYIPTQQNGSAQVPLTGKNIAPIEITYRPPTEQEAYTYQVEFVEWDGNRLIHSETILATENTKTVYAGAYLSALDEKGYWLVNEQGECMSGKSDTLLVMLPKEGSNRARFLVGKQVYEIRYDSPDGMDAEIWAEMEETLPKSYTPVIGAVELPIPGTKGTYEQDGKTYGFTGWKLTDLLRKVKMENEKREKGKKGITKWAITGSE